MRSNDLSTCIAQARILAEKRRVLTLPNHPLVTVQGNSQRQRESVQQELGITQQDI